MKLSKKTLTLCKMNIKVMEDQLKLWQAAGWLDGVSGTPGGRFTKGFYDLIQHIWNL
jgi:hypothetical protein